MCLSIFNVGCSNPAGGSADKNVLKVTTSTDKMESIDVSWTYNISYSDELEFQLEKVDDSKLYGGLIYTYENNIGAKPGDLVDLSNNKVWERNTEIRSTEKTGYMWDVISFLEGDMDPLKYGLPVDEKWMFNNSLYISVKQSTQGFLGFSYYY